MEVPNYTELLTALRAAHREIGDGLTGQSRRSPSGSLAYAYGSIETALRIAESVLTGQECALPACKNPIPHREPGQPGRTALYCGKRCRDRAAYQTRKQREQRAGS
ncbi:hypothetical protein GCM10018980_58420 [Streptomyces capoamus]|uniref:Uncharacterized protein n=1 Tax=Streptomyces capoamus TaxID=68183 RepID=A0A919F0R0_9ACTN|nr:hypothetical protein GCM10010501_48120 [Streptomyces libani subsp. rufus]GHG66216.1 hypothetical protein GCM10018980_58420 [Streptomyces capoamus]